MLGNVPKVLSLEIVFPRVGLALTYLLYGYPVSLERVKLKIVPRQLVGGHLAEPLLQ